MMTKTESNFETKFSFNKDSGGFASTVSSNSSTNLRIVSEEKINL